jgi:predicted dehydrogenase
MPSRPLGTDVAEAGALLIAHESGALSAITLSFAQRPPSRSVEVAFLDGTFLGNLDGARWRIWHADGREESGENPDFDWDRTYKEQAAAFLAAVRGEAPVAVPLEDGIAALRAALALEAA